MTRLNEMGRTTRPTVHELIAATDAAEETDNTARAVAAGLAALQEVLDPVDKRNVAHADLLNAYLKAMRAAGREWFEPADISLFYSITAATDTACGLAATPLHPAFGPAKPTEERAKQAERATHDEPLLRFVDPHKDVRPWPAYGTTVTFRSLLDGLPLSGVLEEVSADGRGSVLIGSGEVLHISRDRLIEG